MKLEIFLGVIGIKPLTFNTGILPQNILFDFGISKSI